MIKHYCDKCGKEIHGIVRTTTDGEIYKVKITLPGFAFADTESEFCYDCLKTILGENIVKTMDTKRNAAKERVSERKKERDARQKLKVEPSPGTKENETYGEDVCEEDTCGDWTECESNYM